MRSPSLRHRARHPDAEFLLSIARPQLDGVSIARANAAIARGVDWHRIALVAEPHGMQPMLHRHLTSGALAAATVPTAVSAEVRQGAERVARRSLFLTSELVALLRIFHAAAIRVVPLKGPLLADQLYGSVALRRFRDLDLLVDEDQLAPAVELLLARGYVRPAPWAVAALEAIDRTYDAHEVLFGPEGAHRVELHHCLNDPLGMQRHTLRMIEGSLESTAFFGSATLTLRPEALLVYLCMHGQKHDWERIEWMAGVAALVRSGRVVDWAASRSFARQLKGARALDAGLQLVTDLLDCPVPASQLLGDRWSSAAARSVATRLTSDPGRLPTTWERLIDQLRTETGFRNRLVRLWSASIVPREADVAAIRLPRALWPAYFLVRLTRLTWSALGQLGRALERTVTGARPH